MYLLWFFLCYDPKELLEAGEDKKLLTGECYVLKVTFMKELLTFSSKSTMVLMLFDVHCGFAEILWREHMYCGPMKYNPTSAHPALLSPAFKISGKNYISMQYYCSILRIYVDIHSLTYCVLLPRWKVAVCIKHYLFKLPTLLTVCITPSFLLLQHSFFQNCKLAPFSLISKLKFCKSQKKDTIKHELWYQIGSKLTSSHFHSASVFLPLGNF